MKHLTIASALTAMVRPVLTTMEDGDDMILHVVADSHGVLNANGSRSRPFASMHAAKEHIVKSVGSGKLAPTAVMVHPGVYASLSIDHPALSNVSWQGVKASDGSMPVISGGIDVPIERFQPWSERNGVLVADLNGLGITDLGQMISGNCVADCQHDQVGLTLGGDPMTLARWPNLAQDGAWQWAHAGQDPSTTPYAGFTMNLTKTPDAQRILQWANEKHAFVHGYWEWDWCDGYGAITKVSKKHDTVEILYEGQSNCKPNARWMGVNMLCELDQPGEYFVDKDEMKLYFYPPKPLEQSGPVTLMHQASAVVNISSTVTNVKLSNMEIMNGRHRGVDARGSDSAQLHNLVVHAHGTHGIDATKSTNTDIRQVEIYDVGCSGIRAVGGAAKTLSAGNIRVENNTIHDFALWKRSYQPGIYWGGVMNNYNQNKVYNSPHNCFLGGGNFEDGVLCNFKENIISDCATETLDSGAFYSCGQGGYAFINRGNVLSGNTFRNILKNPSAPSVQDASVQAVYMDDQMSGWQILNNTFEDCTVANFIGGGRDHIVTGNRFVRCGTIQYLNNQGMTFDKDAAVCSGVGPPGFGQGETQCSTGAAKWMATSSPAAKDYARIWPEMTTIADNHPGWPAYNKIQHNSYCGCNEVLSSNVDPKDVASWLSDVSDNTETHDCASLETLLV